MLISAALIFGGLFYAPSPTPTSENRAFRARPSDLSSVPYCSGPPADLESGASAEHQPHSPFILVLEPSQTLRRIIEVTLRRSPFPVGWALYDGAVEALKDIHTGMLPVPDLALIEQHLPRLDGMTAVHLMRSKGYTTTIVLLLAQDHPLDRIKARLSGANSVLVKPLKIQDLEQLISTASSSFH